MAQWFSTTNYAYLLILICASSFSICPTLGFGDELSSKIDADLFLEDDAGSGDGRLPGFADIDNGSGCSIDDEDFEDCRAKQHGKGGAAVPPVGPDKPRYDDKVDPSTLNNPNEPPNTSSTNPASDPKHEATASFFSQPGILAAIICGAIVGLLCAILLVMFIVYRMRKKDEGSYVLEDSKRTTTTYGKTKEFYA